MTQQKEPQVRVIEEGVAWTQPRHFNLTSEEGAREALARVASSGTMKEKQAVREAAARDWPDIGKGANPRDFFPNSNMK